MANSWTRPEIDLHKEDPGWGQMCVAPGKPELLFELGSKACRAQPGDTGFHPRKLRPDGVLDCGGWRSLGNAGAIEMVDSALLIRGVCYQYVLHGSAWRETFDNAILPKGFLWSF